MIFSLLCDERSFPYTICAIQSIDVKPQKIVCLSLPNRWGFLPTHIKPVEYSLNHSIILSSRTLIHPGLNLSSIFLFYNPSICLIYKKVSAYCTASLVYLKDPSISSKRLLLIYSFNLKGAPRNIFVVVLYHQLCCDGMPSHQSV